MPDVELRHAELDSEKLQYHQHDKPIWDARNVSQAVCNLAAQHRSIHRKAQYLEAHEIEDVLLKVNI